MALEIPKITRHKIKVPPQSGRYQLGTERQAGYLVMRLDKQKIILVTTKYLSYIINTVIILGVGSLVVGWIYLLYKSGTS
jgi:hypothetical protein